MFPQSSNRFARISFLLALVTEVFFCIGFLPIPLTAWVCYPAAMGMAGVGLLTGGLALREREIDPTSRTLAWTGISLAIFNLLAILFLVVLTVGTASFAAGVLQQIWSQFIHFK